MGQYCSFSVSCPVREMSTSPVSQPQCPHLVLSLTYCWKLAAESISSADVYSLIMNVPDLGAALMAGVVAGLLLFFVSGVEWHGVLYLFIVNHQNILLFILLTFPEILPLSIPVRFCHMFTDLNP